jgi:hypothetical protein
MISVVNWFCIQSCARLLVINYFSKSFLALKYIQFLLARQYLLVSFSIVSIETKLKYQLLMVAPPGDINNGVRKETSVCVTVSTFTPSIYLCVTVKTVLLPF